ncbi:protein tweety homolog 1-A-like, partial [Heptranchias perlo]|uniref:protein tweety homolog 1-A-like n=1 Tax=Heptranchias perlo TaxID=212740 RepID=UPI0035598B5F
MYRATYSLANVNHMLVTMETLVSNATEMLNWAVREHLTSLEEIFSERTEFLVITRSCRRQAENLVLQLRGLAFWRDLKLSPLEMAEWGSNFEGY